MKTMLTGAAAVATMLLALPATAQTVDLGTGPGFAIDDSDAGDGYGVFVSTFDVAAGSAQDVVPDSISVTLTELKHTWMGDLVAFLVHDPGTPDDDSDDVFQTLFYAVSPNGQLVGDASDFDGNYTFEDSATASLWDAAAALDGTQAVPSGSYFPGDSTNDDPPAEVRVSLDDVFAGSSTAGTWALVVYDLEPSFDTGSLGSFTVTASVVPEPASALLLAPFGLGLIRRRR